LKSGISQVATKLNGGCMCARCAGPLYFYNLSWFSASDYMKNMEYMYDTKFIEVCVCKKLS